MPSLIESLAGEPFLKGMEPRLLEALAGCASQVTFKPGELIAHEGDAAAAFFILTQGRVAVEVFVPGRPPITIQSLDDGDVLGWSWFYPPYHWHFDARATGPTRCIRFDAPALRRMCDADHDLGYELAKRFANVVYERLQATRMQLIDVYAVRA